MDISKVWFQSPVWQKVENQFLKDAYIPIEYEGNLIGEIVLTKYDWNKAFKMNTFRNWIARENTYLGDLEEFLFDRGSDMARLPLHLANISSKAPVLILDHIKISPSRQTPELINHVFDTVLGALSGDYSFCLMPRTDIIEKMLRMNSGEFYLFCLDKEMQKVGDNVFLKMKDAKKEELEVNS